MMTRPLSNQEFSNETGGPPMDLMVREANHRIANSLQVLLGPVRPTSADALTEDAREMRVRVAAIATVHRLLSATGDLATIDTGEFLDELVAGLRMIWGGQNGVANILLFQSPVRVSGDAALAIGMVINELVTNACKYAYREDSHGDVRVGFSVKNERFLVLVADDGAGGQDDPAQSGFGQRLIERVAAQFEGSVEYQFGHPGTVAVFTGRAELLLP